MGVLVKIDALFLIEKLSTGVKEHAVICFFDSFFALSSRRFLYFWHCQVVEILPEKPLSRCCVVHIRMFYGGICRRHRFGSPRRRQRINIVRFLIDITRHTTRVALGKTSKYFYILDARFLDSRFVSRSLAIRFKSRLFLSYDRRV